MPTYSGLTKKLKSQPIGVISDTHGLVRPEALDALKGAALIIHAGDIGTPEVLDALKFIAPVVAIKGNNDRGAWAKSLPDTRLIRIDKIDFYVIHNVKELDCDPVARGIQVVISGHSHKPTVTTQDRVLFVNPGSAGPRRFRLPISVARLFVRGDKTEVKIIELST